VIGCSKRMLWLLWTMGLALLCLSDVVAQDEASGDAASGDAASGDAASGDEESSEDGEKKPDAKPKSKVPMRKVLEHKKQFVLYPRSGYIKVLGGGEELSPVDHVSLGMELQLGLKQKFVFSFESHLLYINTGFYGLSYSPKKNTVESYSEKTFTSLSGVGVGMFTKFLDKQELWTHLSLKAGYLHPFYVPIWLGGDIEKEFRRTRGSYWVVTAAPMAGVLIPLKEPVIASDYEPVDELDLLLDSGAPQIRFMVGAQVSIAFIFAPRS